MPFDVPFKLGPFIVDSHGRLEPSDPARFPSFHVVWRQRPVHARLDATGVVGDGPGRLVLSAVLGRVPSTGARGGAAANVARRGEVFAALRGLEKVVEYGWQLRLLPDHRVLLDASREIAVPASVYDLLTQITCFLLDLGPYFDLIEEGSLPVESPPMAGSRLAGTANT